MSYPPYDAAGEASQRQPRPPPPPSSYSAPYPSYSLAPYPNDLPDPGVVPRWDDAGQIRPFSNTGTQDDAQAFNPQDHTAASPSSSNPNTFSSAFVPPRFVAGANINPFTTESAAAELAGRRNPSFEDVRGARDGRGRGVPMAGTSSMAGTSAGGGYASDPYPSSVRGEQAVYGYAYEPQSERGYAPPIQPAAPRARVTPPSPSIPNFSTTSSIFPSREPGAPQNAPQPLQSPSLRQAPPRQLLPAPPPPSSSKSPVYDLYGSSYISITPALGALKLAPSTSYPGVPSSPSQSFNPEALGLPLPPPQDAVQKNWKGLYSTSGMDMVGILARVAARPRPQISIGPVDLGCSFLVVDARAFDFPIVYASETFSILTGYSNAEILGRNCRFLQSPDGIVAQGSKRQFTDGNAVHHLRQHITTGRETQASLINYAKGGHPFVNLVTCIPITWDTDEIAYYVGFQVNLVDQPAAILDKMKNGTYVVNYSMNSPTHVGRNPALLGSYDPDDPSYGGDGDEVMAWDGGARTDASVPQTLVRSGLGPELDPPSARVLIDIVNRSGMDGLDNDVARKQFQRLLLDNCDDFVHVVSLKGVLLYVSPSTLRLLEYDPKELVGQTLASICHPSDIVAVLRDLKESGSADHRRVSVMYRARRKFSGYVWLEANGKLHLEAGKGRKSVILIGRPTEVLHLSLTSLEIAGGLGEREYWSKLGQDGRLLYATPALKDVLEYDVEELVGMNVSKIDEGGLLVAAIRRLAETDNPTPVSVRHTFRGKNGLREVVTNLYPSGERVEELMAPRPRTSTIIAQTILAPPRNQNPLPSPTGISSSSSLERFGSGSSVTSTFAPQARPLSGEGEDSDSDGSSASSISAIPSTFKTLSAGLSDNVFDELETTRGTSWQFELHQLRLTNKKLREEKEAVMAFQRKLKRRREGGETERRPSRPDENAARVPAPGDGAKVCANCGRDNSPEWRTGPTVPRTLCNACGLRWKKSIITPESSESPTSQEQSPAPVSSDESPAESVSAQPKLQGTSLVPTPTSAPLAPVPQGLRWPL